jgi:hypothetical protein
MKDYLGNEFLIWLWWMTETAEGLVKLGGDKSEVAVLMDKALDMDCAWGALGKQTLRAEGPTKLAEAGDALATGKWPRKAGLMLAETSGGEAQPWVFTLQADRWIVSSAALPDVADAAVPRDLITARLEMTGQLADTIDGLFKVFLKARVGSGWPTQRKAIREWIVGRRK